MTGIVGWAKGGGGGALIVPVLRLGACHGWRLRVALAGLVGLLLATGGGGVAYGATLTADPDATVLAKEIADDPGIVVGAEYEAKPPVAGSTALVTGDLAGFPTGAGAGYGLLTTGAASLAQQPNTSGSSGRSLSGPRVRGNSDFDVTVLRIDLDVPETANCLVGIDFRFASEEYPEFVGSRFNDAFIAEVDSSTWTTSGSTISAPRNFAFDPEGQPISINATGTTSMRPEFAAGTTYDGATPALTAATPLTPGRHSLYLSIFDQGDRIYDSAVFVDNLRVGRVGDVERDCRAGAEPVQKRRYYALGDSYSSGFGVEPYAPGTHGDQGPNDCQRSDRAYSQLLRSDLGAELAFHACQGAVTKDFYEPRNDTWGEAPQLDHLEADAGLATFTIGGNDAGFADVVAECILGAELLPFNTCHGDDKVTEPVRKAFARLDGRATTPTNIVPYDRIFKDVRARTPHATRVAVGYPHFYPEDGGDRTFLPGGRCEGVKKADQRWMVEKIDELNGVISRNAQRNGFRFVDPSSRFDGHELCGGGEEWIFGVLSAGRFHPTADGHRAIADEIRDGIPPDDLPTFTVGPGEVEHYTFFVDSAEALLSIISEWPGSDVVMTLISPSGKRYERGASGPGVYHANGPTWEQFEILDPEAGEWEVELFGAEVEPEGEPTTLSVYLEGPPNQRPRALARQRRQSDALRLDARSSTDADGQITAYDWYLSDREGDRVLQGAEVSVPVPDEPLAITLVVTDDQGLTDFTTLVTAPIDVLPGSDENPFNRRARGRLPVAVLSGASLDATTIDPATLRLGPGEAAPVRAGNEDVDGDGRDDLLAHFDRQAIDVGAADEQLCLTGTLPDGRTFESCDLIRVVP